MNVTQLDATTWLTDSGVAVTWDGTTLTIAGKVIAPPYRQAALRAALGIVPPPPPDTPAGVAAFGGEIWTPFRPHMTGG